MATVYARNVSEALYVGLDLLRERGEWHDSRSGRVIEYPTPVMTIYKSVCSFTPAVMQTRSFIYLNHSGCWAVVMTLNMLASLTNA